MNMKNLLFLSVAIFSLLIFSLPVFAEQTIKTVEIPIGYVAQTVADNDYINTITIKPPDGIEKIISMEFFLKGDFQSSTEIKARFRKTGTETIFYCEPNTWTTPDLNVPNYEASFDCSSLIDKYNFVTGNIDVGFRTSKIAQNVKGYVKMTYYNSPKPKISLLGTEYVIGDNGTIFLELVDSNNNPIDDAFCEFTVWYPNESVKFMDKTYSNYLEHGIYYKDFLVPNEQGVYMVSAYCFYSDINYDIDEPYEVNYDGSLVSSNDTIVVKYSDCSIIKTTGSLYHDFYFNSSEIGNINLSEIEKINLIWYGANNKNTYLQIWNYSSSSWVTLGSQISSIPTIVNCQDQKFVSRTINSTYYNFSDFVNGDEIRYRIYVFGAVVGTIWSDNVGIILHDIGSVISEIRGSGELHVTSWLFDLNESISDIPKDVWEYPIRNLTYYPPTDYQQISEFVWNFSNRTVNLSEAIETLLSVNSSIFSKLQLIQEDITNLNNLSAEEVWLYSNKTVNLTEIINFLTFMNDTITVYYNETIERIIEIISEIDLTNTSIINEIGSLNNSIFSKLYLIQGDLSDINTTTWDTNYWVKENNDILINLSLGNVTVFADINWTRLREEVWNKTSNEKLNHDVLSFTDKEIQLVATTQFCIDNTTLAYNHNITRSILGYNYYDNLEEFKICTYGCYNNECRQAPYIIYGSIFLLIIVISSLIFYFSPKDEMT